jgi:phage terminase large subunit-like protein
VAKDPVTAYAERVRDGKEVASYLVRLACLRHLADITNQKAKGLVWKPDEAQNVIDFFAEVLILPENTDADDSLISDTDVGDETRHFILSPFQAFIAGSLFGWYTAKGHRRFHQGYIETAKGSGKTPLGAGIMLYMLVADGERGAQVYAAAVGKDQAKLAFTDAERMVEASPYLSDLVDSKVNNLAVLESGSFFRPISSEKRGLDGKRVHGALIDELHEHPTPIVVNKMRKGIKGRRNALILEITNSGFDRTSVCWNHHEYSRKVLEGTVQNEEWFAFVCGLDPCDACRAKGRWFPSEDCAKCDDWRVEGPHWLKANPNLGVSLPWDYVRNVVNQAKGMPSEVSDTLRFTFCVWTQGESRAIDMGRWAICKPMPLESELISAPCFGCLDLGETDDFSAWGKLWLLPDGRVAIKMRYFLPEDALHRFHNRPYDEWKRSGVLTVTDGPVTDYEVVRAAILKDYQHYGMQSVTYDTKSARETAQILAGQGVTMVAVAQGFALHEALKRTLELIVEGELCHGEDPILAWMASNAVVVSGGIGGAQRLDKERSPEKIDGIAALVMGVQGAIIMRERTPEPRYEVMIFGGR